MTITCIVIFVAGIFLLAKLINQQPYYTGCFNPTIINELPTLVQTNKFCQEKGYEWGTVHTLLCGDGIQCFKKGMDGGLIVDCLKS
jgi:hypothetical protein